MVSNLLSNVCKYSSSSRVRVQALAPRQIVTGMTPEQQARVTERFYRADTSGHVLGTGLGMRIVDNIVTVLGGSMELRSEPGEGTTVSVWLPPFCRPRRTQSMRRTFKTTRP